VHLINTETVAHAAAIQRSWLIYWLYWGHGKKSHGLISSTSPLSFHTSPFSVLPYNHFQWLVIPDSQMTNGFQVGQEGLGVGGHNCRHTRVFRIVLSVIHRLLLCHQYKRVQ
jgi:hypothetical protein